MTAPANEECLESPSLVVFSGLPGTGKSRLAEALGRRLRVPVFAKDWLDAALLRCGVERRDAGRAGYELLGTLASRQLVLGQSAILDSVASYERIRTGWRELAGRHGAGFRVVLCSCSDAHVHRARLRGRERGIPGWAELSWTEDVLEFDAMQPFEANLARLLDAFETLIDRRSR